MDLNYGHLKTNIHYQIKSYNIYVDNLSNNPGIGSNSSGIIVTSVLYTMGIPSVQNIDISINRTFQKMFRKSIFRIYIRK